MFTLYDAINKQYIAVKKENERRTLKANYKRRLMNEVR